MTRSRRYGGTSRGRPPGLALTDEAFHPTVLTLWRNRLRASGAPQRIFDAVRQVIVETGVIAAKHRRVLDSTVLDDAVARQDTVTMLVEQIRRVRRLVPALAGVPVREHNLAGGRPPCDWDDPADRDRLVSELVDDANELVWAAEDLELTEAQADAVALLALVAGQDVEPGDGPGRWRIAPRTAGRPNAGRSTKATVGRSFTHARVPHLSFPRSGGRVGCWDHAAWAVS